MDRTRIVRRWRRNMDVADDAEYVEMLASVRYSPTAGIAMTFKPIEAAQLRQRAVNRP